MNNNSNNLINIQLCAVSGFIIALILSFLLTYNEKLINENKGSLFNNKTAQEINATRSTIIFIVTIVFLYVNYTGYKTCSDEKRNDAFLNLESSLLSIIIASIGIYMAYKNYNQDTVTMSEIDSF